MQAGADTIYGSSISNSLDGGRGNDTIYAGASSDILNGGSGDDILNGEDGNDTILGGLGSDTLNGGSGDDILDGGTDSDYVDYSSLSNATGDTEGIKVNLSLATQQDTKKAGLDTLSNIENVIGSTYDDTIIGNSDNNTIIAGSGNDTITTGAGANDITLGAGKDTVIIASTKDGAIIADAVIGEDKIILTGTANNGAALNVAALGTITAGAYTTVFGTNHKFTLTGSTASDLSGLVQFGKQAVAATATTAAVTAVEYTAADFAFTAGSADDQITTGSANVNAGAGNDVITTGKNTGTITGGAGSDTFVISNTTAGTATIADLGATDILQVTAGVVTVDVVESFTATAATTNAVVSAADSSTGTTLTLKDGVNVDMTLATLAGSANGYTIKTDAAVTTGATIVGSRGDDTITGSKFADTITGGEGQDTITAGAGADTIILTESVSAIDTVVLGTVTAAGIDTIVGFNAGTGIVGGQVDTIKTSATANTSALVLSDKGTLATTTYANLDAALASFATTGANATTALNAYTFKYDSKDYLLIDNGTAGYDAATDSVVEITGLVGILDATDILNA